MSQDARTPSSRAAGKSLTGTRENEATRGSTQFPAHSTCATVTQLLAAVNAPTPPSNPPPANVQFEKKAIVHRLDVSDDLFDDFDDMTDLLRSPSPVVSQRPPQAPRVQLELSPIVSQRPAVRRVSTVPATSGGEAKANGTAQGLARSASLPASAAKSQVKVHRLDEFVDSDDDDDLFANCDLDALCAGNILDSSRYHAYRVDASAHFSLVFYYSSLLASTRSP